MWPLFALILAGTITPGTEATVGVIGREGHTLHRMNGVVVAQEGDVYTFASVVPANLRRPEINFTIQLRSGREVRPVIHVGDDETGVMVMTIKLTGTTDTLASVKMLGESFEEDEDCNVIFINTLKTVNKSHTLRVNLKFNDGQLSVVGKDQLVEGMGGGVYDTKGYLRGLFGEGGQFVPMTLIKEMIKNVKNKLSQ